MISFSLFVQTDQYERYAAYHPWSGLGLCSRISSGWLLPTTPVRVRVSVQYDQCERYAAYHAWLG